MGLILNIPDIDDSDSPFDIVQELRYGFPADGLLALYLLTDGVIGSAFSGVVRDYSGSGNDATLISGGAVPTQRVHGLEFASKGGFTTPVPAGAPYTVVLVGRQTLVAPATNGYVGFHSLQSAMSGATPATWTGGGTGLTLNVSAASTTDANRINLGLNASASVFPGSANRLTAAPLYSATGAGNAFFAAGYAVDRATDRMTFRSTGGAVGETVVKEVNDLARNATGAHRFGLFSYNTGEAKGDLCVALIYDHAKTASALDAVLAAAKATVAARSVTVV